MPDHSCSDAQGPRPSILMCLCCYDADSVASPSLTLVAYWRPPLSLEHLPVEDTHSAAPCTQGPRPFILLCLCCYDADSVTSLFPHLRRLWAAPLALEHLPPVEDAHSGRHHVHQAFIRVLLSGGSGGTASSSRSRCRGSRVGLHGKAGDWRGVHRRLGLLRPANVALHVQVELADLGARDGRKAGRVERIVKIPV